MNKQALMDTARALVADDKGLLAMDESNPTCNKRSAQLGIPQTEEVRRAWRELIVTTPGLGEYISGGSCATRRSANTCHPARHQSDRLRRRSPALVVNLSFFKKV